MAVDCGADVTYAGDNKMSGAIRHASDVEAIAGRCCLILDDSAFNGEFVARTIEMAGGISSCVVDIESAVRLLNVQDFDVLICDWNLGAGTAKSLLHNHWKELPATVVILTGEENVNISIPERDCDDVLIVRKPVKAERLIALLSQKLRQHGNCSTDEAGVITRTLYGADWFDVGMYEELSRVGKFGARVSPLLETFVGELEKLRTALGQHLPEDAGDWPSRIHAIRGLAETAGARNLARVACVTESTTASRIEAHSSQRILLLAAAEVTRRHVEMFLESVSD